VPAGFQLNMSAPSGVIYFTTDGSDPRIPGSGAVSPTAAAFSAPLALPSGLTTVKARVRDGALWSALNEAAFQAPNDWSSLKLTEIMYNPLGGSDFEFLELKNIGPATLNLAGVQLTNGVDFSFPPLATLGPGQFAVLANDPTAFAARYPGVPLAGEFARDLGNGGDTLTLLDPQGGAILTVQYDDVPPWPTAPDGLGYSLVIVDPLADPAIAANWRTSSAIHGSPHADDPPPSFAGVVINEVLAHSDPPFEDAIELRNLTATPIDVGGWFLSDDANSPTKFRIPDGTVIAPGGFAVFYEYQFNPTPGVPPSFGLSSTGERLFLLAAEPGGAVIGFADSVQFDPSPTNTAIGRFQASTAARFTHLSRPTFGVESPASLQQFRTGAGAPNAYPLVGPLVINELMYNPPSGGHEFIELRNLTRTPLPLYDPANPTSVWRFTNGIEFDFPPNSAIPPLGLALVVPIDPAIFAATYNVPADVQVFGPFTGALDNGGETLSLSRPDTPNGATVPYIPVDTVTYDDAPPWPTQPDGSGPSLERLSGPSFPDDPVLWQASSPASSPGQPNNACHPADVHPNKNHSLPGLCDYDVDIADVQTVAACWNLPLNAPNCPPSLNTDGLDPFFAVGDIVASAASWGWRR
jgi:hypothetical protein